MQGCSTEVPDDEKKDRKMGIIYHPRLPVKKKNANVRLNFHCTTLLTVGGFCGSYISHLLHWPPANWQLVLYFRFTA